MFRDIGVSMEIAMDSKVFAEDIEILTVEEVCSYLVENDVLSDIVERFKDHEIDGDVLLLLDESDLIDRLGMKLGPAKKLLRTLRGLDRKHGSFSKEKNVYVQLQDDQSSSAADSLEMLVEVSDSKRAEVERENGEDSGEIEECGGICAPIEHTLMLNNVMAGENVQMEQSDEILPRPGPTEERIAVLQMHSSEIIQDLQIPGTPTQVEDIEKHEKMKTAQVISVEVDEYNRPQVTDSPVKDIALTIGVPKMDAPTEREEEIKEIMGHLTTATTPEKDASSDEGKVVSDRSDVDHTSNAPSLSHISDSIEHSTTEPTTENQPTEKVISLNTFDPDDSGGHATAKACNEGNFLETQRPAADAHQNPDANKSPCMPSGASLTARCVIFFLKINLPLEFRLINNEPSLENTDCIINTIQRKTEENDLEKAFTFIVITKRTELLGSDKARLLWTSICKEQMTWFNVLPTVIKQQYCVSDNQIQNGNTGEVFCISDGKVNQVKLQNVLKRPVHEGIYALIVEESLTPKVSLKCHFRLDERVDEHIEFELNNNSRVHATFQLENLEKNGLRFTPFLRKLEKKYNKPKKDETPISQPDNTMTEEPREFDTSVRYKAYTKSYRLNCCETGALDLIEPVHELKLFRNGENILYFLNETFRFACACLNSRTNGTIHFGIADGKEEEAAKFDHYIREIVGTQIKTPDVLIDKLTEYLRKCFNQHNIARKCVRAPVFVPVRQRDGDEKRVVIEVDVVPSIAHCRRVVFTVASLTEKKDLFVKDNIAVAYFRDGSSSRKLEGQDLNTHWEQLDSLDEQRLSQENKTMNSDNSNETSLHVRLRQLVCKGGNKLSQGLYPVLVLTKPDPVLSDSACNNLDFIKSIDWKFVIDFDDAGLIREKVFPSGGPFCGSTVCADVLDEKVINKTLLDPYWIWGNGSVRDAKKPLEYKEWRLSTRNRNLSKVIERLAIKCPRHRVLVMFLLLSKYYQDGIVLCGEFFKYFGDANQLIFIAENEDISTPWVHELSKQYLSETQALDRSVIGMPWSEMNQSMKQFSNVLRVQDMLLPSPSGTSLQAKRENFDHNVIHPLGVGDCREIADLSIEEQQMRSSEEELDFYRGSQVTWSNFWFDDHRFNHVLRRSKMDELLEKTKALLNKPIKEGRQFTLNLLHQAGAGASTLAKHALWYFSQKEPYLCRCCFISKINNATLDQILHLRQFKCSDTERILPVLALVDGIDDNLLEPFFAEMERKILDLPSSSKPVVVFIRTKECALQPEVDENTIVFLCQHLENDEKLWFQHKFHEMSKRYVERFENFDKYATENLISFMIMKEDFNPHYGRSVAKRSLRNANEDEQELLKCLSLLGLNDTHKVYATVFDDLMVFQGNHYFSDWLSDLTPSTKVLLKESNMSGHYGSGTGLAILHPLIANAIIDEVMSSNSVSVADITLGFLKSPLPWNDQSLSAEHFRVMASILLTHRTKYEHKGESESQSLFPPVIEKILYGSASAKISRTRCRSRSDRRTRKQDIVKAEQVLVYGLEMFKEPRIAQQLARLFYLHAESFTETTDLEMTPPRTALEYCFDKALEYATRACQMHPNNACFIDTVGRIHKKKFEILYPLTLSHSFTVTGVTGAIKLALEGVKSFQKVQSSSRSKNNSETLSGHFGELSLMTNLLEIFRCIPDFSTEEGQERLRKYLRNQDFIPECLYRKWEEYHNTLKRFTLRFQKCISQIREEWMVYSTGEDTRLQKELENFCSRYHEFFSSEDDFTGPSEDRTFESNWNRIDNFLMGEVFSNVFNINKIHTKLRVTDHADARRRLLEIRGLITKSLKQCPPEAVTKTNLAMITVSMALHSPYKGDNIAPSSSELEYRIIYDFVRKYAKFESQRRSPCLYSHLLKVMFLWPRDDVPQDKDAFHLAKNAINVLRQKFSTRFHSTVPDLDQHPYSSRPKVRAGPTLFFLGKGSHLNAFVHVNELTQMKSNKAINNLKMNWNRPYVQKRLRRLEGQMEGNNTILVRNPSNPSQNLKVLCDQPADFKGRDVTFFLGFSWNGPVAVEIKEAEKNRLPEQPSKSSSAVSSDRRMEWLDEKLQDIRTDVSRTKMNKQQRREVERKAEYLRDDPFE